MWEDFNTAVQAIDVAALDRAGLGDLAGEIGRTRAVLDGLEARITVGLRRLGASEASAAETLRRRTGCSTREAKHRTRRAEALRRMPNVADALSSGRLTGEHASALARAAAETSPEAVDRDAGLLVEASSMPADAASSKARDWVRHRQTNDDLERLHQWQRRNRSLLFTAGEGGMIAGIAKFDRVSGAQFQNLVEALADRLYRADGGRDNPHARTRAQCRHDALLTLVGIEPAIPSPGLPSATSSGPRSDSDDSNANGSAPDGHHPVLEAATPGKPSPRLATPRPEPLPDRAAHSIPDPSHAAASGTIPTPSPGPGSGRDVGGSPSSGTSPGPGSSPSSGTSPGSGPSSSSGTSPGSGLDVGGSPSPDSGAGSGRGTSPGPAPGSGLDVAGRAGPAPGSGPSSGSGPGPSPGSGAGAGPTPSPGPDSGPSPGPRPSPGSGSGLDVGGSPSPSPGPGSGSGAGSGPTPSPGPDSGPSPGPRPSPGSGSGSGSGLGVGVGTVPGSGSGSGSGLGVGVGTVPGSGSGLGVGVGAVPGSGSGLGVGVGAVPGSGSGLGVGAGSGSGLSSGSGAGSGSGPSPGSGSGADSAGSGGVSEVVRNGRASSNGSGAGSAGSGASEGRGAVPGIVPGRGLDTSGPYPGAGPGCACGRGFGPKAQLCVVMDVPYLATNGERGRCEIPGVGAIARSELQRLGCDPDIYGLLFDQQGLPLYHGRKTRRVSPQQWRVLVARDKGCVICGAHPNWCQAHHVRYWRLGGPTDIDNLALLCHAHHRWVHDNEIILRHGSNGWYAPTGLPPPGNVTGRSARSLTSAR